MAKPQLSVRVAFVNNPFVADSTLTWTDISADVRLPPNANGAPITIRRGRQSELGRVEAGTMSLTLDNRSRQYDSEYTSGPYYPNVVPMKRIQVLAVWNSVTYKLFTGYVSAWTPAYPGGFDAVVRVTASDAFNAISRSTVSISTIPPGESSGNAIRSALTLIGWPLADYTYHVGQTTIPAGTYANQNTLQYVQTIVETENGLFFVRGDGVLVFQDRQWRIRNSTSSGTFGDGTGEIPYESLTFTYDESLIYNDVQVTPAGGSLQEAVDTISQAAYGPRVLSKSGLLMDTSGIDALGMAQWLLLRYKTPALRIPQIVLNGDLAPTTVWPQALGRSLSEKITVVRRPPGSGTITKTARIEAISHAIALDKWTATWDLSMAGEDQYWLLQDSALGVLDTTTRLAF